MVGTGGGSGARGRQTRWERNRPQIGQSRPWVDSPPPLKRIPPTAHTDRVKPHVLHVICQSLDSAAALDRERFGTNRWAPACQVEWSSNCDQSSRYHDRSGAANTDTAMPSVKAGTHDRAVVSSTTVVARTGSPGHATARSSSSCSPAGGPARSTVAGTR